MPTTLFPRLAASRRAALAGLLMTAGVSVTGMSPGAGSARAASPAGGGEVPADAGRGLLGHVRQGEGPEPVVVLHEWMGDHTNYDFVRPFLPGDTHAWVFADLRGYGLSKPLSGAYSLDEAVEDVLRLMDHYGHARFHVVGHSMSGMIAQALAKRGGERVKSVVAVSPVPASGFKTDAEGLKKLMAVVDNDDAVRAAILARGGGRYGRGWVERKLAMTRRAPNREAMVGYLTMFTGTDVADAVRGIPTPITAVCGEHDLPLYRAESITRLLGPLFPNLEVVVSREAGHYAMLETPPLLAGQIEKGLARGV